MQAAITTFNLHRSFGRAAGLRGVDLHVPAGSIYGFLGPNGAGKTTTIRLLTGLLRPTSGTMTVLGLPMPSERLRIARLVGALVETPSLYEHLTGRENLDIARRLLKLPCKAIDEALETADLRHAADQRVGGYSLGMRQRLALSRALLGEPRLLILDEPANGLDPDGIRDLRDMLRRLSASAGTTIFVSSHQLAEVEQIATWVGVMAEGRLVAQGPLGEVLADISGRIQIRVDRIDEAKSLLDAAGYAAQRQGGLLIVDGSDRSDPVPAIVARLVEAGLRLREVRSCAPRLEDLYVHLTRAGAGSAPLPAPAR